MERLPTLASITDVEPLSPPLKRLLMNLQMQAELENEPVVPGSELVRAVGERFPGFESAFPFQVLAKRLEVAQQGLLYSPFAVAFLAAQCDNPGKAVMYAYTIKEAARERGRFDVSDIERLFPKGLPTERGLEAYWDAQKVMSRGLGSDNLIDRADQWRETV